MKEKSKLLSPFRYPGAKANLTHYIKSFIHENMLVGSTFVELFAGGASVALEMLNSGVVGDVLLIEKDPLIAAFWMSLKENPDRLCEMIHKKRVNLGLWKKVRKNLAIEKINSKNMFELGYAGLLLNRTCFSGIISAGPIGGMSQDSDYPIDCRFNHEELISRIQRIAVFKKQIKIKCTDANSYLLAQRNKNKEHRFFYADPPYYVMGHRLYRHSFKDSDHVALANNLHQTDAAWLLSYDNHKFVRGLYKAHHNRRVNLSYSIKQARKESELIISNYYLPKPIYNGGEQKRYLEREASL